MSKATREEVLACYRHILGREPENEETLSRLIGWDFWALVHRFSHSDEHRMKIGRASSHSLLKCLNTDYLARGLPAETRASAVIHNYAGLQQRLAPSHLLALLERGLPVFTAAAGDAALTIDASLFDGPVDEGEISLIASYAGRRVAVLTFTIVAGDDFGLACISAVLVSRIQGYRGAGDDVRNATRAFGVAPPLLLVAALEGVANALGIRNALCVGASNHPCSREDLTPQLTRAYDDLFVMLGAERLSSGFYHLRLPHAERPIEGIASAHRARSRKRRAARNAIAAQAQARWRTYLRQRPPRLEPPRQERPRPIAAPLMQDARPMRKWSVELMQAVRAAYRRSRSIKLMS